MSWLTSKALGLEKRSQVVAREAGLQREAKREGKREIGAANRQAGPEGLKVCESIRS